MPTALFSHLEHLTRLAERHGVDMGPTLLRILTDLYVERPAHASAEERMFTELVLRLLATADARTRAIVSAKLAAYPHTPAPIRAQLMAAQGEQIAADRPAGRPAPATDDALGAAAAPPASPEGQKSTQDVAAPTRSGETFFAASPAERGQWLKEEAGPEPPWQGPSPIEAAEAVKRLDAAALAGRPGQFIREIEGVLGLPRAIAEQIVNDSSGEPLVVLAKALEMPIDVLQRVLLLLNPAIGHSVKRVYDLCRLFQQTNRTTALQLVSSWRALAAASPRPAGRESFPAAMRSRPHEAAPAPAPLQRSGAEGGARRQRTI